MDDLQKSLIITNKCGTKCFSPNRYDREKSYLFDPAVNIVKFDARTDWFKFQKSSM